MQHCIAWQRIVPFLGLLHQLAFAERTGQRGVPYQITGVKRFLAVTTPAIFLQVGRERDAQRQACRHDKPTSP